MALDLSKPVWFYDDRAKSDDILELDKILWQDETFILCRVKGIDEPCLYDFKNGKMLNGDYFSWIATNDISWLNPKIVVGRG